MVCVSIIVNASSILWCIKAHEITVQTNILDVPSKRQR